VRFERAVTGLDWIECDEIRCDYDYVEVVEVIVGGEKKRETRGGGVGTTW
jgi:hypothetical protein